MTYEPFGAKGMKVTVESVNAKGEKRINEIINKRNGVVAQVLTNVLSPDGNAIGVMYLRMDASGQKTTNVTLATYERVP